MNKTIKIILVDDHLIVRDGIRALLEHEQNIQIVGEAENGKQAISLVMELDPDIILMDISMPDISGIEVTRQLKEINKSKVRILILSMYVNEDFVNSAIKAGANGYLPKNTSKDELIKAIKAICEGNDFYGDSVSQIMVNSYLKNVKAKDNQEEQKPSLTKREQEILKLVANGSSNQEIADALFISIRTVESHKNHIMQKLGFNSTIDLIKYALKNKIISL